MKKLHYLKMLVPALLVMLVFCGCSDEAQSTPPLLAEQSSPGLEASQPTPSYSPSPSPMPDSDGGKEKYKQEDIFLIEEIPDDIREFMKGKTIYDDSPVGYDELRYLTVTFWSYDDEKQTGNIIVNEAIAEDIIEIFRILLENKFPIEKIRLADHYGGSDELSMRDNNTSGFNDRPIEGSGALSYHQLGLAVDINPLYNPYIKYSTNKLEPSTAEEYLDRSLNSKGMIYADDICVTTFKQYGFTWGGDWNSVKDYQHFEKSLD